MYAKLNPKIGTLKVPPTPMELANLIRGFIKLDQLNDPDLRPLTISDEDGGTVRRWYIEGAGWLVCRYDRWQLQRGNPVHGLSAEEAMEAQAVMRYAPYNRSVNRNTWLTYADSRALSQDLSALGHGRRDRAQAAQEYWNKRFIKLLCLTGRMGFVSTNAPSLIHHGKER